jgi:HSP20 family protein
MAIKDLVPRLGRRHEQVQVRQTEADPLRSFQRDVNRLFDDFLQGFPLAMRPGGMDLADGFMPRVDVSETEKEVRVSAELPGMDEKEITVELADASLTIRGEKKAEKEEKGKNWHAREQSFGSFLRVVPLPCSTQGDRATAKYRKGILTVVLPKRGDAQARHHTIPIENA